MSKIECCETKEIHQDVLEMVKQKMPNEEDIYDLAELYKVFGDSTRMKILFVLFEAEVCVCDLAETLQMCAHLTTRWITAPYIWM